jgi:hypothetical protein
MSGGRTIWWGKDCAWWEREAVVALGEEFGAEGPAILDWLSCKAKAQNDGGYVKAGFRSVARGCFIAELVTVSHVLSRAVTLGSLDDYEESGVTFTCRISGWKADQARAGAAVRKAKSREFLDAGHALSRPVTVGHAELHTAPHRKEGEGDAREPDLNAAANDETLRSVVDVLRSCPRLTFDLELIGVAHSLAAYPNADAIRAAHIAVSNATDPNYRTTDAGKALRYALNELEVGEAKRSRHLAPVADRDRERAVRDEEKASIARLMNNTQGDVA